jgi:hypothetical protein
MRSAVRQNGRCNGDLRDGHQRSSVSGENARQSVIDYAKGRAKFRRGEIRVISADGSIQDVISFDETFPTE